MINASQVMEALLNNRRYDDVKAIDHLVMVLLHRHVAANDIRLPKSANQSTSGEI
jgi:hypothetical protein